VFEHDYAHYNNRSAELSQLPSQNIHNYQRQNYAYMVNAVPSNWTSDELRQFLIEVQVGAEYIYVTDSILNDGSNIYGGFGRNWGEFVDVMGTLDNSTI
jgi:Spherulation-specific family 4